MNRISQFIECTPVPKGRPRVTVRGARPVAYTPQKTAQFEALIAKAWQGGKAAKNTPLRVVITVLFYPPKSWPKKRREALHDAAFAEIPRGDVDNYAKSVLDALNGVAYDDDTQVVELFVQKKYNFIAEGVAIEINEITN